MKLNLQKCLRDVRGKVLSVVAILLLATSCAKRNHDTDVQQEQLPSSDMIKVAKDYYSARTIQQPTTFLPEKNSKSANADRISAMASVLLWQEAKIVVHNDALFVIVATSEDRKPFINKNYEFQRFLVFSIRKEQVTNMTVLEFLGKPGASLGTEKFAIAERAVKNRSTSQSESLFDLHAYALFYDEQYKQLESFNIEKGAWSPSDVRFRSDKQIVQKKN